MGFFFSLCLAPLPLQLTFIQYLQPPLQSSMLNPLTSLLQLVNLFKPSLLSCSYSETIFVTSRWQTSVSNLRLSSRLHPRTVQSSWATMRMILHVAHLHLHLLLTLPGAITHHHLLPHSQTRLPAILFQHGSDVAILKGRHKLILRKKPLKMVSLHSKN